MKLADLSLEDKQRAIELLEMRANAKRFNRLAHFSPYDYQKKYIKASAEYTTRFLMAANRVGKSEGAAFEVACHATGRYPDWWEGRKFSGPIKILCAGVSNSTVRDIMQDKLLGEPTDKTKEGEGFLPLDCIVKTSRKAGVPDAISSVSVRHDTGGESKIVFQSYESGKEAFMGTSYPFINLDEEPPEDIYSQALRAVVDCNGIISITATPENGLTGLVRRFMNDIQVGQYLQNATWDDAPHLTKEVRDVILAGLPEHQRKMRSMGIPSMGSGLIYPVSEEDVSCEAFDIPAHWPRIAGIDFGYEHDFAWVRAAWDREADIVYITDCYKKNHVLPDGHVQAIQQRGGRHTPTAWPKDGWTAEKGTGVALKSQYAGLYLLPDCFLNPADPVTGKANSSVEAGIMSILERMQTGRLKIFTHLDDIFEELRMYHRKDGKIVKKFDDVVDALRYCVQSLSHAQTSKLQFTAYNPAEHDDYYADTVVGY